MAVLKVILMVLATVVATSALRVDTGGRPKFSSILSGSMGSEETELYATTAATTDETACCDACICTKSIPPQCRCMDSGKNHCHSACKSCACTLIYPPELRTCICLDITDFCYPPCTAEKGRALPNKFLKK